MTTNQELLDGYPHCRNAVVYCEVVLDGLSISESHEGRTALDLLRQADPPVPFETAFRIVKGAILNETDTGIDPVVKRAILEVDHPSFRTYLRAKLGMM